MSKILEKTIVIEETDYNYIISIKNHYWIRSGIKTPKMWLKFICELFGIIYNDDWALCQNDGKIRMKKITKSIKINVLKQKQYWKQLKHTLGDLKQ